MKPADLGENMKDNYKDYGTIHSGGGDVASPRIHDEDGNESWLPLKGPWSYQFDGSGPYMLRSSASVSTNSNSSGSAIASNTTNALLGVSVFSVPYLFAKSGVLGGSILIIVVSRLAFETVRILLIAQRALYQRTGVVKTYPEIVADLLGKHWSPVVKLATIVSCLGACTSFVVFFVQLCGQLFDLSRERAIGLACISLTLLSWIRTFRELALLTTIGVCAVTASVCIILYDGYVQLTVDTTVDDAVYFQPPPSSFADTTSSATGLGSYIPFHHEFIYPPLVVSSVLNMLGPATFIFTIHYCVLAMGGEALLEDPWPLLNSRRSSCLQEYYPVGSSSGGSKFQDYQAIMGYDGVDIDDDVDIDDGDIGVGGTSNSSSSKSNSISSSDPLVGPLAKAFVFATVLICVMGIGGMILFESVKFPKASDNSIVIGCEVRVCRNAVFNVADTWPRNLMGLVLCGTILLNYTLLLVPAREHTECAVLRLLNPDGSLSSPQVAWSKNMVRSGLVLCTCVVAWHTPYFGPELRAIGGFTDAFQAFVLPPLIYAQMHRTHNVNSSSSSSSSIDSTGATNSGSSCSSSGGSNSSYHRDGNERSLRAALASLFHLQCWSANGSESMGMSYPLYSIIFFWGVMTMLYTLVQVSSLLIVY